MIITLIPKLSVYEPYKVINNNDIVIEYKPIKNGFVINLNKHHMNVFIHKDIIINEYDDYYTLAEYTTQDVPEDILRYLANIVIPNLIPLCYRWKRKHVRGYEVSSKGDKRFSAFNAYLKDRESIETKYQLDVKGYRIYGNDWKLGKGKEPINRLSPEELYAEYKALWYQYFKENPELLKILQLELQRRNIKILTDMFASSQNNQARAISEILNEEYVFN